MLTTEEKENILAEFPKNIKLSYENIVHKKVSNYQFVSAIPQGKKAFAWFTKDTKEKPVCYLLELQGKQKQITEIRIVNTCFDSSLSYGTIFYGTIFHHQKQSFYSIEDLFYYQGQKIQNESWNQKLSYLKKIMDKQIKQVAYNPHFVIFGLPLMETDYDELMKKIEQLPYRVYSVHFRNDHFLSSLSTFEKSRIQGRYGEQQKPQVSYSLDQPFYNEVKNEVKPKFTTFEKKYNLGRNEVVKQVSKITNCVHSSLKSNYNKSFLRNEVIFKIRPDLQNDIYHLYCSNEKGEEIYHDVAYIPDYKTSLLMNRLFRKIKENENLDALEESDDEEEFENEKEDRFVYLDREYNMICNYHYKFKKWVPLRMSPPGSKISKSKDLPFLEKNKH